MIILLEFVTVMFNHYFTRFAYVTLISHFSFPPQSVMHGLKFLALPEYDISRDTKFH